MKKMERRRKKKRVTCNIDYNKLEKENEREKSA